MEDRCRWEVTRGRTFPLRQIILKISCFEHFQWGSSTFTQVSIFLLTTFTFIQVSFFLLTTFTFILTCACLQPRERRRNEERNTICEDCLVGWWWSPSMMMVHHNHQQCESQYHQWPSLGSNQYNSQHRALPSPAESVRGHGLHPQAPQHRVWGNYDPHNIKDVDHWQ